MIFWDRVSDLGDTVSALASAAVIAVWAWRCVSRPSAAAFLVSLAALIGVVIGLKLLAGAYAAAPDQTPAFAFSTGAPSGHAALASFVYGSAALFCRRAGRGGLAAVSPLLLAAVVAAVAATRVTLGFHTIADVMAGLLVGGLFLLLIDRVLRAQAVRPTQPVGALLTVLLLAAGLVALLGVKLPSTVLI